MGWITEADFDKMDETVQSKIAVAVKFATESPEPNADQLYTDVFAPVNTTQADIEADKQYRAEFITNPGKFKQVTYAQISSRVLPLVSGTRK